MSLMTTIATAATLLSPTATESERLEILARHISPAPGEMVRVAPVKLKANKPKDLFDTKGYITFTPPKGFCFTVRRHKDYRDVRICKKKTLAFRLRELDKGGRLNWRISTGPKDFGHLYTWPSPHRVATLISAGEKIEHEVPVETCIAHPVGPGKNVRVTLFSGEEWKITFPRKHKRLRNLPPQPNLYIPIKHGGPKRVKVSPDDPVTKHWAIPIRYTYTMSSSHFKSEDVPPGMKGECRYQFSRAPRDRDSGWMECHYTDRYDVVLLHLPCLGELKPKK